MQRGRYTSAFRSSNPVLLLSSTSQTAHPLQTAPLERHLGSFCVRKYSIDVFPVMITVSMASAPFSCVFCQLCKQARHCLPDDCRKFTCFSLQRSFHPADDIRSEHGLRIPCTHRSDSPAFPIEDGCNCRCTDIHCRGEVTVDAARRAQLLQTAQHWRALTAVRATRRRRGQLAAQTACLHKWSHPRLLPAAAHRFSRPALLSESRQAGFPAQDARLQEVFVRSRTVLQNFPSAYTIHFPQAAVRRRASPHHVIFSANC